MTEPGVTVATATDGDECVLTVAGEIDLTCSAKIADLGVGTLQSDGIRRLVVDLSAVTFMDSTGLGALIRMHHEASIQGKVFSLRNPSAAVQKVLRLTAVDTVLSIDHVGESRQ